MSDLHLSTAVHKPMEIFGYKWKEYVSKIYTAWTATVKEEDLVIIPGDISWAARADDAIVDLGWISKLPGTKLLLKGNHDYWWSTISKVRNFLSDNMYAISNEIFYWEEIAICGIRGWLCPGDYYFDNGNKKDDRIYKKEAEKLAKTLESRKNGYAGLIVAMHFPPYCFMKAPTLFTQTMESHGVDLCVYGHLHDTALCSAFDDNINGVEYRCISADRLDFKPLKIVPFEGPMDCSYDFAL